MSIARYSFIQMSELAQYRVNTLAQSVYTAEQLNIPNEPTNK